MNYSTDYILRFLPRFVSRSSFVQGLANAVAIELNNLSAIVGDAKNYFANTYPEVRNRKLLDFRIFDSSQGLQNVLPYIQARGTENGIQRDVKAIDPQVYNMVRDVSVGSIVGINFAGLDGNGQVNERGNKFVVGVFDLLTLYSTLADRAVFGNTKKVIGREIMPVLVSYDYQMTPTTFVSGMKLKSVVAKAFTRIISEGVFAADSMHPTRLYALLDSTQSADSLASWSTDYRVLGDRSYVADKMQRGMSFVGGVTAGELFMQQLYLLNGTPLADAASTGDAMTYAILRATAGFVRNFTDASTTNDTYTSSVATAPPTSYTKSLSDGVAVSENMAHTP